MSVCIQTVCFGILGLGNTTLCKKSVSLTSYIVQGFVGSPLYPPAVGGGSSLPDPRSRRFLFCLD